MSFSSTRLTVNKVVSLPLKNNHCASHTVFVNRNKLFELDKFLLKYLTQTEEKEEEEGKTFNILNI